MFDLKTFGRGTPLHFVGIAGIGMSSIAEILKKWGYSVQGSNDRENENVASLRAAGIKVLIGHRAENVEGAGAVVFSSAVPADNVELAAAGALRLPIIERAELLNMVMNLRRGIAVAGTHGKTTTTSFVGTMLDVAGLDPTIINGGIMNRYGSHNRIGAGEFVVAEACEAFGNIRHFTPHIAVITNIDAEHMDYYHNFDNLVAHFKEFAARVPRDGLAVLCADHPVVASMAAGLKERTNVLTYACDGEADVMARGIKTGERGATFDALIRGRAVSGIRIPLYGRHNVQNALAAVAIAEFLGIKDEKIRAGAAEFLGNKHRFSFVGKARGVRIFDDYGHHPKEIAATLAMAREVAGSGRVFALWEPHRYTRTTGLFREFASAFGDAHRTIVLPIYSAGEGAAGMKTQHDLAEAVPGSIEAAGFDEAAAIIAREAREGDMAVSFSAGALKNLMPQLPAKLEGIK